MLTGEAIQHPARLFLHHQRIGTDVEMHNGSISTYNNQLYPRLMHLIDLRTVFLNQEYVRITEF